MANRSFFDTLRRSPIHRGPNRVLGGVCGGIAAKFGWNPTTVRLVTVIAFLLPVIGFGTYAIAWLLLPRATDGSIVIERLLGSRS
ncbi:PspC domain-containing protein [Leucobacter albus]|uniref:PspC domain-containing protein n=1 Tax=Leucobacter albus TaxID=272210 RepID=A0ABW3TLB1_9MICO